MEKKTTKTEYNAKIQTTTSTQTGNEVLGTKEKKLHYLVITTETGSVIINVGEKTIQNMGVILKK